MKLAVLNNEFSLRPQAVKNYEASGQHNSRNSFLKDSSVYPQDQMTVSSLVKHVIQSTDSREVELTYSVPLKEVSALIIDKKGIRTKIEMENLPQELRVIDSPELFSSFVKNTYAKVNTLSNGECRLYVNHKLLGGGRDDPEGSMTPRTQGGKIVLDTEPKFEKVKDFKDDLSNRLQQELQVIKNGLNTAKPSKLAQSYIQLLKESMDALEGGIIFTQLYQQNIRNEDQVTFAIMSNNLPQVTRVGININALRELVNDPLSNTELHHIERELFQYAINQVLSTESASSYIHKTLEERNNFPNNVILADIFVGRKEGKIKEEQGLPEIHTVVLWKKADDTIVLIDPSAQGFSSFLRDKLFGEFDIKVELPKLGSKDGLLYGINYSEYSNKNIKRRDCIDVAAKIGLELNELQKVFNDGDVDIIQKEAIKHITNDIKVNDSLDSVKKLNLPFGDLLSTSKEVREYNYKLINNYASLKAEITNKKLTKFEPVLNFEKEIKSFKGLETLMNAVNLLKEI